MCNQSVGVRWTRASDRRGRLPAALGEVFPAHGHIPSWPSSVQPLVLRRGTPGQVLLLFP